MSFKTFDLSHDVASIVSSINEVVSVSSSIFAQDANMKLYTNIASASAAAPLGGYWQTVYDSSPASSTSTPLMDVTFGYSSASLHNVPATATSSQNEKIKIYRMMAANLLGNPDLLFEINSVPVKECFFVMIKRGIQKDEIKKGATSLTLLSGATYITASDDGAVTNFKQTVGGDYSPLKVSGSSNEVGQVWYNAGVMVLQGYDQNSTTNYAFSLSGTWSGSSGLSIADIQTSGTINHAVDGLRLHMDKINFHNQTNLYSTIYFCRATNTEFNYSSNPTFVDSNKRIRVTSGSNILQTRTYITTIGLYDANDNLLAAGKVNKPITKAPDTEATMRIRLDF